jgi:Amt family ammonium transporter
MKGKMAKLISVVLIVLVATVPTTVWANDPSGRETAQRLKPEELNATALNFAWLLLCAALVFQMQAGFALLGAGLIRAKNTVNYLTKSFLDFSTGAISYWAFGFAFMFGGATLSIGAIKADGINQGNAIIGYSGFFLAGAANDVTTIAFWFFQMVFAATAATIVAGAMAERTKISAYIVYSFIVCGIIYPIYGHWIWGNGWLANLNIGGSLAEGGSIARDFAGSGVVHALGGVLGLIGAWAVGARKGKFDKNGKPRVIPGHNMALVVAGTFSLFFGWFGFNGGSTFAATDLRISVIIVNTMLAGVGGAVIASLINYAMKKQIELPNMCNGALAGLVSVTGGCAFVETWAAFLIGAVGGILMLVGGWFVEHVLKIDDPISAFAVHGIGGIWGLLAIGIFADGKYLGVGGLITGNVNQLTAQFISIIAVLAWATITGLMVFFGIKFTIGLRASEKEELVGLDLHEHGTEVYTPDTDYSDKNGASKKLLI